jgi:transposase
VSNKLKVVFKNYTPNQTALFPPSIEEMIEPNHPVKVVNQVIESINIDPLLKKYKSGGTSSYHPRMMLKILVYAYLSNVYSSRKMEAALKENIHFMWLSGMGKPDHNTLNRFRSERLKDVLKEVFAQVVKMLTESGHVSLQEVYTDGTKIEANANRYTFVWGNSIKSNKQKIEKQLEELWNFAEKVSKEELQDQTPTSFAPVDAKTVKQTIDKIDQALEGKKIDKKVKQKLTYAKKNWPSNIDKYKEQEQILNGRNSYSKTDTDATFMRMKEDHMRNGQLKPAYNLQISTKDQFILHYSLHQSTTDTTTLKPHYTDFKNVHQTLPQAAVADAGYGSDENYQALEELQIESYVKYNYFDKDCRSKKDEFNASNFDYDESKDEFYCPAGQALTCIGTGEKTTQRGFKQKVSYYKSNSCKGCFLKDLCHNQKGDRVIQVNHRLRKYKEKVKKNLLSEQGILYRKQRPADVETVFGQIKSNKGFRRFNLRGIKKVEIETGLLAIAHNLQKLAA